MYLNIKKLYRKIKEWLQMSDELNETMDINKHITEYLNNYLKIKNPEFAILLSGKWGSGKTHFINKFIEETKEEKNIKFIKISLFGLKNTDSIDEQIFQNIYPLFGNKYFKLSGSILKNALKLGIKLNWNGDNQSDGTSRIDLSKVNPLDFFSDSKDSKEELFFIFDDLERTDIELTEVLGYINYLVEGSSFKVILIANEDKLTKDDESTTYNEFKEKVIGKTFEVQHNFQEILNSFIEENTSECKELLLENIDIIENIYKKANYNNLRHIKQILLEFEYFANWIANHYLKNQDFSKVLINNFFALAIEAKSGKLKHIELSGYISITLNLNNTNKEKSIIEEIYEKYNIKSSPLFSAKIWVQIIFTSSMTANELNILVSKLIYFVEEQNKVRPSWVKLWYFRELEDNEFQDAIKDVFNSLSTYSYTKPEHFLHVIALLIFFRKQISMTFEEIQDLVDNYIHHPTINNLWKYEILDRQWFNKTGLGYMDEKNSDFQKIFDLVIQTNQKQYAKEQKNQEEEKTQKLLTTIDNLDEDFLIQYLLKDYGEEAILQNLDVKTFVEKFVQTKNKNISKFAEIFYERYKDNRSINGKRIYFYLKDELPFWREVKQELERYLKDNDDKSLKTFLLENFIDNIVNKTIKNLSQSQTESS